MLAYGRLLVRLGHPAQLVLGVYGDSATISWGPSETVWYAWK